MMGRVGTDGEGGVSDGRVESMIGRVVTDGEVGTNGEGGVSDGEDGDIRDSGEEGDSDGEGAMRLPCIAVV